MHPFLAVDDEAALAASMRRLLAFGVAFAAPERQGVLLDGFDASPGAAEWALSHTYDADVHTAQTEVEDVDAPCLWELEFVPGLCGLPVITADADAGVGGSAAVTVWELAKTRHASGAWVWAVQDVVTRRVWPPVGMLASLRPPLAPPDVQCALARFFRTQPAWEVLGALLLALRPWRVHLPPCCYATLTGARPDADAVAAAAAAVPTDGGGGGGASGGSSRDCSDVYVMLRQCWAALDGDALRAPWPVCVEMQAARRVAAAGAWVDDPDMTSVMIVAGMHA